MKTQEKTIWTIGHSTHSFDVFLSMLNSFKIGILADVRRFPGSGKFPHFNKDVLKTSLQEHNISYMHFEDLGGRRKTSADSKNTGWKSSSFRGYADYMETDSFKAAMEELEKTAIKARTAYMCSEAVWWRCHRSMISDYLKVPGWKVMHIMSVTKAEEHPFTAPARIVNGKLNYELQLK